MVEFLTGFMAGAVITSVVAIFLFKYLLNQGQLGLADKLEKGEERLSKFNSDQVSNILNPLKEKLSEYQNTVEKTYSIESRERFSLQKQVESLIQSNEFIGKEASNLSRALKGDVKVQGVWGEKVLQSLLEKSGLEEGREYTLQGKGVDTKDSEGKQYRPDVMVFLPKNSFVVVDSKVSLTHFMSYLASEDQKEKTELKKQMKKSFQTHIDCLASKNYQSLEGINSPDFVFMFIPVESALAVVMESFPEIIEYSWKKNIVIATPSTLMSSLRTIGSIWKIEKQSHNAQEIAKKGGVLYDKLVSFYEDIKKVGDSLEKTQKSYDSAIKRLQYGKGSLMDRASELKELGVDTNKGFTQ